jgi:hypothetical protein
MPVEFFHSIIHFFVIPGGEGIPEIFQNDLLSIPEYMKKKNKTKG